MSITLYGIPNCDTVKKARGWLDGLGLSYHFHDYKKSGADRDKLRQWSEARGWETILNRRASLDPGRAHAGDASRASVSSQVAPTGVCRRGGVRPR